MPTKKSATDARVWLATCRAIGVDMLASIPKISGTAKAAAVVNAQGAGGDETTYVDALAEKIIAKHLAALRRDKGLNFSLLTEEAGAVDYGAPFPLVVIDPIDGSINCKRGIPLYAVSIAVFDGPTIGNGVFGYVMNLANGDEFHAASGSGKAYLNGKRLGPAPPRQRKPEMLFFEMTQRPEVMARAVPLIGDSNKARSLGSLTLGLAYTASGGADAYVHLKPSRVLDYAAAKIIIEESGGIMTDEAGHTLDNTPLDLKRHGMLAAARNKAMLDYTVKALANRLK